MAKMLSSAELEHQARVKARLRRGFASRPRRSSSNSTELEHQARVQALRDGFARGYARRRFNENDSADGINSSADTVSSPLAMVSESREKITSRGDKMADCDFGYIAAPSARAAMQAVAEVKLARRLAPGQFPVHLTSPGREDRVIYLVPEMTLRELSMMIEGYTKVPLNKQRLFHHSRVIWEVNDNFAKDWNATVKAVGIQKGDEITVFHRMQ